MRIALYHGYELTGSGSNEYARYLSRALADAGHEVHVICREPDPAAVPHVALALDWPARGEPAELLRREAGGVTLHRIPHASVRPVFLMDKQREGVVKAFPDLTDAELEEYHRLNVEVLSRILERHPVDVLHANHLVYQPVAAAEACRATRTPFVVFPHGSSIEYTLRSDARYRERAEGALLAANGLVSGSREMLDRIDGILPDLKGRLRTEVVGVGVDTRLFRPVARSERADSVERLLEAAEPVGKDPALTAELHERLDRGDVEAVTTYLEAYDHSAPDADLASKLRAVDWEAPVLFFVGALTVGKGVQSLIAAMPAILERHPRTRLIIVGSGSYREALEALVHAITTGNAALLDSLVERGWDLGRGERTGPWKDVREAAIGQAPLAGRVTFLGRLDHRLLPHLFPCADLAVFPSLVPEAYPLVLMESLANGVLPLATDFSGLAEGLSSLEPHLGRDLVDRLRIPLEPAGRVAAIAAAIGSLLDEDVPASIGPRLRAVACEQFDWSERARQLVEAYERLLSA